jgi:hypothetical protein
MEILIKESQYNLLLEQSNVVSAYNDIVAASSGLGTNPDKILKAFDKIRNLKDFTKLLSMFKDKKTGYGRFSDMINQEYERDNYDDAVKLKQKLYPLGVMVSFNTARNGFGQDVFRGNFTFKYNSSQNTKQNNTSNKNCVNKTKPLLSAAKKNWVDWLSSPITKQKFIKNWSDKDYDINDVNRIFKNYINSLNNLKLIFYNNSMDSIEGVDLNGSRNSYAFVTKVSPNNIFFNCSLNNNDSLGTLIHEIQHILYYIHPLNPDHKVEKLFVDKNTKKLGPFDFLSKLFKNSTDNNSNKLLSQSIQNVSTKYGVKPNYLNNLYSNSYQYEKKNPGYACSMNEKMSNIMSMRKLFNIKPGQNITLEMLNPYIKGEKRDGNVSWLLSCWALKKFPDINTLINNMNQLAYQDFKKQDNSRLA